MTQESTPAPRSWRNATPLWLLLTTILGLPLISPLWRATAVACTHDGHLHYHRIAALRYAWEHGVIFSRWLPDVAFGYGYPFFVFREAPPLIIPLIPHLLGVPLPAASNMFYALTILAAGWFMFLWVRDLFGERAAIVSAVAYMSAPYLMIDALVRGNSPESLALPLFPLVLWAGRRWVLSGTWGSFLGGVLGLALLSFSHNISLLIFVPTLLVYLLVIVWVSAAGNRAATGSTWRAARGPLLRTGLLIGLGLALALFYTGSALAELNLVTLEQSTTTRNNDWRLNFAGLAEVFARVAPEDPRLMNPPMLLRLGWVPAGLALLGISGLFWIKGADRHAREQRAHIVMMAIATAVFLFMALPLSRWLWDTLPLIEFVQFPWRFVGRAALPVAFLAGVGFAHPVFAPQGGRWRWAWLAVPSAVGLLLLESLPNLYPRYCREDGFPTIVTVHDYEHATGLVGVDPEGSYFPRTVRERPTGSPLEADYRAGRLPQRFDATALPPGATLEDVVYDGLSAAARVTSPQAFTARYLTFAYPGWRVTVDGLDVPITPEDPSGLITFPVPAGTHEVRVAWVGTPLRVAFGTISLLALLVVAAITIALWFTPLTAEPRPLASPGNRKLVVALLIVGLGVLAFKLLVVDRGATPWRRESSPSVAQPMALQGGQLRLDGYTLSRDAVGAGETFDIDMAWTVVAPPAIDYQSNVWLVGPEGLIWSDKGTERPRVYEDAPPTREWGMGNWGWDSREVRVLPGTPPGTYDIVLTLFDKATLQPLTLFESGSNLIQGPTAVIGQMTVREGGEATVQPQYPLTAEDRGDGLALLGYNQDRDVAMPGEGVLLTLFWQRVGTGDPTNEVVISLLDESGQTAQAWTHNISRADYPPAQWAQGETIRGQYWLQLPADLPGGRYRLAVDGGPELATLQVVAPDRETGLPPLDLALDADFAWPVGIPMATLAGLADEDSTGSCLDGLPPGEQCSVPLVWQAQAESPISYNVFIHLVDSAGNIVAQADGVPANWERPTTGWLPGEVILDRHTLTLPDALPEGPLALRVGLYDPSTGERLQTADGDFVTIPLHN